MSPSLPRRWHQITTLKSPAPSPLFFETKVCRVASLFPCQLLLLQSKASTMSTPSALRLRWPSPASSSSPSSVSRPKWVPRTRIAPKVLCKRPCACPWRPSLIRLRTRLALMGSSKLNGSLEALAKTQLSVLALTVLVTIDPCPMEALPPSRFASPCYWLAVFSLCLVVEKMATKSVLSRTMWRLRTFEAQASARTYLQASRLQQGLFQGTAMHRLITT